MGRAIGKIVNIGLYLFFGVFLLIVLRGAVTAGGTTAEWPFTALGGIAAAASAMLLVRLISRKPVEFKKTPYVISIAAIFAAIFALQCIVGWGLRSNLDATPPIYLDIQILHKSALELIDGQQLSQKSYFLRYTHQLTPLYFFAGIYKLAELMLGYVPMSAGIAVNIFLTDIGLFFLVLLSQRIAGHKKTLILMVLLLLFMPLYTYMPFVYFDTMVLPFITAPLYLYVCFTQKRAKKRAARLWELIAAGLLFGMGIALRRTVAVAAIAAALHIIWTYRDRLLKGIAAAVILAAAILAVICASGLAGERIISAEEQEKYAFPKTHWVMMALNGPMYNNEDAEFTASVSGYDAKKQANLNEIKRRVHDMGAWGTIDRLWENQAYQWSDGTFRAGIYLCRAPAENGETLLKRIFTKDGDLYSLFRALSQIYYFAVLTLMLVSLRLHLKDKKFTYMKLLLVIIAGTVLFFLFWEANPKYLLPIMPLMLMLAADGMATARNT